MWRVVEAQPAHTPENLTDDIRQQVVADLKMTTAYERALAAARQALARAQESDGSLYAAATAAGKTVQQLEPLSLKGIDDREIDPSYRQLQQMAALVWRGLREGPPEGVPEEFFRMIAQQTVQQTHQLVLEPSVRVFTPPVPLIGYDESLAKEFLRQAFELAPADGQAIELEEEPTAATAPATEPATQPATGAATQPATAPATEPATQAARKPAPTSRPAPKDGIRIIEMPAVRTVFVVQRLAFRPGYEDEYQAARHWTLVPARPRWRHRPQS